MSFENEIKSGDRFKFGENWSNFLNSLNNERVEAAERELSKWLGGKIGW